MVIMTCGKENLSIETTGELQSRVKLRCQSSMEKA